MECYRLFSVKKQQTLFIDYVSQNFQHFFKLTLTVAQAHYSQRKAIEFFEIFLLKNNKFSLRFTILFKLAQQ